MSVCTFKAIDEVYLNSFNVICVWYHVTCLLGAGEGEREVR